MERRRPRLDPLQVDQVNERLALVLADQAPRRAQPAAPPDPPDAPELDLELVDDLPEPPRFSRWHVKVVAALLVLGLLGGGWALLRARPVAVASPGAVAVSPPALGSTPPTPGPSVSVSPASVVVHVLGAVRKPGLVTLADPSRVQDAIAAAGGMTPSADPGELNLAQLLTDGQQLVIGTAKHPAGEVRDGSSSGGGGSGGGGGGSAGSPVDLNRATQAQLEELPGVGPVTAGKIVAWRTEHQHFSRVEELQEVDGIGPKTYAQIAPHVRV